MSMYLQYTTTTHFYYNCRGFALSCSCSVCTSVTQGTAPTPPLNGHEQRGGGVMRTSRGLWRASRTFRGLYAGYSTPASMPPSARRRGTTAGRQVLGCWRAEAKVEADAGDGRSAALSTQGAAEYIREYELRVDLVAAAALACSVSASLALALHAAATLHGHGMGVVRP